jgi:HD-like signal output (HDOD) protein
MADTEEFFSDKRPLDEVLKGIESLVSLPEVYLKFRQLLDSTHSSLPDFAQVVLCDPNLTALVLKFVNSPLYGFSGSISSISVAISLLGTKRVHDLVLAATVMKLAYPSNAKMTLKAFWRCSLYSGVLARILGKQLHLDDSESLFVAGLLHQIGYLVLYAKFPEQAEKAWLLAKAGHLPAHEAELAVLGFHYGQVGAKLMALWRLPVDFQVMAYYQPTPLDAPMLKIKTALLHLVHAYAHQYILGEGIPVEDHIVSEVWQLLGINNDQLEIALGQAKELTMGIENSILG